MIAPSQIVRFIDNRNHRTLIDRLLSNGRCHSPMARHVLHAPGAQAAAAIGLGLQRIAELAYWALPEGVDLAHRLLHMQRRDGHFGLATADIDDIIASTAIGIRALTDWLANFKHDDAERSLVHRGVDRACLALRVAFNGESNDEAPNPAAWAVVLWQLGDCDIACKRLPLREIREHVRASDPEFRADDLSRLALTMAA
jgi:hypothetical protein